ncbi:MAG TPA: HAD-IC family P-type ATPase [Dehalococcoidales bacterium]|nr:HAD-IC family P-type ATPase [Dehalococcoidales bacterium]
MKSWYQMPEEEVFSALQSNQAGLSAQEAKARLAKYGYNELKVKKRGPVVRFLLQFHNPLLYVLLVAAGVAAFLNEFVDMWVIIGVVLATVIIGFIQEGKAESSLEALKKMLVAKCHVLRSGETQIIATRELVPGDVVVLEGGDRVPADIRLFSVKNLSTDEAALTGESMPVLKDTEAIPRPNLSPGQQKCMSFSGTFVTRGRAHGVVVATAKQTELGKIAGIMEGTIRVTPPIIKKITAFTKFIIIAILGLGAATFALGIGLGYEWSYMFLATVGMIVAMIPEGLPAALIAAFAFGTIAMSQRNALIRRLPATETLGCTTVICSDKTGTLTRNEMTVVSIYSGGKNYRVSGVGYEPTGAFFLGDRPVDLKSADNRDLADTLRVGLLCNNSELVKNKDSYTIKGDPTEGSLVVAAAKAGTNGTSARLDEIPFEADQQYMATLNQNGKENLICVKGSPERVLARCRSQQINGEIKPLQPEKVLEEANIMASQALRVLAVASKNVNSDCVSINHEDLKDLVFLGFQGMIDPPRGEAIEAIKHCKTAGIRVVMITGDHVETGKAIAAQLGIGDGDGRALTGEELQAMSDEALYKEVEGVSVYARAAPVHKYRIVKELQKHGHVVAVTGDGVNDAPALKRADIGVAMGITGTEVSKEAADMVLIDDNFATMVSAVEEGRHVFTNIWKVILYLLPTNVGQGLVLAAAILLSPLIPVFALRLPIEPVMILWVNLIIAIACGIPLIWEVKEKGLLKRPPRNPNEKLANPTFIRKVGMVSLVSATATLSMFLAYTHFMADSQNFLAEGQTVAFTTLIMVQVMYLFTARSIDISAFTFSPFSNKWVVIGAAVTIALQILLVYSQPLFGISPFKTMPFPAIWWVPIILISVVGFLVIELEKLIMRRKNKKSDH